MSEKLTVRVSPANKRFLKRHARQQNKSMSQFIDELLSSIKKQPLPLSDGDEWEKKSAGLYQMGSGNVLNELFNSIRK